MKRHGQQFAEWMEEAQHALLRDKVAMLAHALAISEQGVERLGRVTDSREAASRDGSATSHQTSRSEVARLSAEQPPQRCATQRASINLNRQCGPI